MKSFAFIALFLLTSCASLSNGANQLQPVVLKDPNSKTWFTTCTGAVEEWSSCQNKARKTCPNGYETLEKMDTPASGGRRELTFMCK